MILTYHLPLVFTVALVLKCFKSILLIPIPNNDNLTKVYMINRDIFTIQRKLFLNKARKLPRMRLGITLDQVIDTFSVFGLVLLVGLVLVL